MNKEQLIETIRAEREKWDALLAQVDPARMTQPGAAGEWSVKDIIAHVTWHEREMVGLVRARALVGSDLWGLPTDQRNAAIFEENRHRSLDEVLAEAQPVFQQLMESMQTLADRELTDPSRFKQMPADWQPWKVIASNTYEHYHQHISDIQAWIDESGKDA